jgi:hypothetical protein
MLVYRRRYAFVEDRTEGDDGMHRDSRKRQQQTIENKLATKRR